MNIKQEPKYEARDGGLYNRASGERIPDDEPVFILRARDVYAYEAIVHYADSIHVASPYAGKTDHEMAVRNRAAQFAAFYREHHDRMQKPTTVYEEL